MALVLKHSKLLEEKDGYILCARLDALGKETSWPFRWYSVKVNDDVPDWTTVEYHMYLMTGLRRLGLISTFHPDEDKS